MATIGQMVEDHDVKQRVISEYVDLQYKHQKLKLFLGSKKIHELEPADQSLLFEQYRVMGLYIGVLEQRIERFNP